MPHRIHTIAKRGWRACMPAGVVLAGALLLAGCDQQRLAAIRPGETTESEIVAQWGTPENVWMTPQGERVLEYNRQPNGEANYMITIGANGRVATFQNVLTRANFAHIQPGMHIEAVRQLLGRPAKVVPYAFAGETVHTWRWREGTGGAPYRLFEVTTDQQNLVKRVADTEEPSHSERRRR